MGTALNGVCKLGLRPQDIALIGQSAEHWVGCNCGIMDQLISACGKADHSLLIDCRDLSTCAVTIPEGLSIVIVNSNFKHQLAGLDSEYNQRRSQVRNQNISNDRERMAQPIHSSFLPSFLPSRYP